MKQRSSVLFLVPVVLLALTGFVSAPGAHAMSPNAFPLKGCALTHIVLHGYQPATITCTLLQKDVSNVHPDTQVQNCYDPNATAEIAADQGDVCFGGYGYLGIHLTHLSYFWTSHNGWMKLYNDSTSTAIIYSFFGGQLSTYTGYPTDGNHDITQFCEGC